MQIGSLSAYQSFNVSSTNTPTQPQSTEDSQAQGSEENSEAVDTSTQNNDSTSTTQEELTPQEQQMLRELQSIDTEVRAHEAAHMAAGGSLAGGATYQYTQGPDGRMYATSGEVPISMVSGDTPEATIRNAQQIQAAAMAPGDPSPQDYQVAASAAQMEGAARMELAQENYEERLAQMQESSQNTQGEDTQGGWQTPNSAFNTPPSPQSREDYTNQVIIDFNSNKATPLYT